MTEQTTKQVQTQIYYANLAASSVAFALTIGLFFLAFLMFCSSVLDFRFVSNSVFIAFEEFAYFCFNYGVSVFTSILLIGLLVKNMKYPFLQKWLIISLVFNLIAYIYMIYEIVNSSL
jgi:hypothetical protein